MLTQQQCVRKWNQIAAPHALANMLKLANLLYMRNLLSVKGRFHWKMKTSWNVALCLMILPKMFLHLPSAVPAFILTIQCAVSPHQVCSNSPSMCCNHPVTSSRWRIRAHRWGVTAHWMRSYSTLDEELQHTGWGVKPHRWGFAAHWMRSYSTPDGSGDTAPSKVCALRCPECAWLLANYWYW